MKSIIFLLTLSCLSPYTYAQDHAAGGVDNNPFGYNVAFSEGYDQKGKPLTEVNKQVMGERVLNTNWGKGYVKFRNGFVFKNMQLQFDLYSNELHFMKDSIGYNFVDQLLEFSMSYQEDGQTRQVTFRAGYPNIEKKTAASFYKVVADGGSLQLLNYVTKEVREKYDYLGPLRKEYQQNNVYYLYDLKTGVIKNINLNKNSIIKKMPAFADKITTFAEEKHYKLKSEDEAIELFKLLNL